MPDYDRAALAAAFRRVGVRAGDVVFSHANVGYFGRPAEGNTPAAIVDTIVGAFFDVLGPAGTLVVPTFTYSFPRGEPYDPVTTPSTCGALTEIVRQRADARRSHDPLFSVAAIGARADELTANVGPECFGRDSFWERFEDANGIICNLNFDAGSTFLHYIERDLTVPYRADKVFTGEIVLEGGRCARRGVVFFCRDLADTDATPAFEAFDALARARGVAVTAPVGRGAIVALRARDARRLLAETLPARPHLLTARGRDESKVRR